MVNSRTLHFLMLLCLLGLLVYLVNPWVYNYIPVFARGPELLMGRPGLYLYECIGFIPLETSIQGLRVTPGDLVCLNHRQQGVFESLKVGINVSTGYWVYRNIALFYANTSRPLDIEILVEKPVGIVKVTLVLYNKSQHVLAINVTGSNRYRLLIPQGTSQYEVSLIIEASKPGREIFRVGFYINES